MQLIENFSLKSYNTFGIDAKTKYFALFQNIEELRQIFEQTKISTDQIFVLGGGSNILFTQDYNGLMLKSAIKGIEIIEENNEHVYVKVGGGEVWHNFVLHCVNKNWGGIKNLSLIPGTLGASPIQNIGAYGVEIKDTIHEVEIFHLNTLNTQTFTTEACKFGYRDSIFKHEYKGKIIILSAIFKLNKNPIANTTYGDINKELESQNITNPTIQDVSKAICKIRNSKLPDPKELGNAGSFFKNPIVSNIQFETLKATYPTIIGYKSGNNLMKLAAGWLIEQCGWKGKRIGDAGVHKNQALVLVNYGNAKGAEIIDLAHKIQDSVKEKFSVNIEPEINIV